MTTEADAKRLRFRDAMRVRDHENVRPRRKISDRQRRIEDIEREEYLQELREAGL